MAYTVYITRALPGATDPSPILQSEWRRYVAADPELQRYDYAHDPQYAEADVGYRAYLEGLAAWLGPGPAPAGERAWFSHQGGQVLVEDPDAETLQKATAIAQALQAQVRTDADAAPAPAPAPALTSPAAAPSPAPEAPDHAPEAPEYGPRPEEAHPAWESSEFRPFRTYASAMAAQPLLAELGQRGVPYRTSLDNGQLAVDPTFAFQQRVGGFNVKLRLPDFELARQLQDQLNQEVLPELPPTYYLFAFTDAELFDVLTRADEWSSLDVTLARVLLEQRGRDISPDTLELLRQRRLLELAQPEPSHKAWILTGYLLALLGGGLGILIGWQLHFHRKTLPDGRRVYAYTPATRRHGLRILVLAVIVFALVLWAQATTWHPTYWQEIRG